MKRPFLQTLRRHAFLAIGLLTLCLFVGMEVLSHAGRAEAAGALAVPVRVLIVPMWIVWTLMAAAQVAIAGPGGLPQPFQAAVSVVALAAGLLPYALLDYGIERWRRR